MCNEGKGYEFGLLLVDVDRFKTINDTFGHDAGDKFLVVTAQRLGLAVRSTDKVARLGGDEFAILLAGTIDEECLRRVCDRIVESFSEPVSFRNGSILASVSVGIALFPEDGDTPESLNKSADLALYEAKRRGRNTWCMYTPELRKTAFYGTRS
jgi:diguanylate cyclase (GGDEF)-like protein